MRELKFFLILYCLLNASASFGVSSNSEVKPFCNRPDIEHIQVPLYPQDGASPRFNYSSRYRKAPSITEHPTIIYLPGGPGDTSIESSYYAKDSAEIPDEYEAIFTDPRGAGCNEYLGDQVATTAFSTDLIAADVIAMINHLKLKNYILYGQSYGTVLATVIGARAAKGEAPLPSAIVLHSTVGHGFTFPYSAYAGLIEQWDLIKSKLPKIVLDQLSAASLPFGFSGDNWGTFLVQTLGFGIIPDYPDDLRSLLMALGNQDQERLNYLKSKVEEVGRIPFTVPLIYRAIWCHELSQTDNIDVSLIGGNLIGGRDPDFCKGFPLINPFDSKAYALKTTLFYISGENDPFTSQKSSMYHFESQTQSARYFVSVPGAGHVPFFSLADCANKLWQSIFQGGVGFQESLSACKWPTKLTRAAAGELVFSSTRYGHN